MATTVPGSRLVSDDLEARAIAWRRHLHANPELSFEEHETSAFIEQTLRSFGGLEIERPAGTSVVARLQGVRPGKVVVLRGDIDALPIQEENVIPHVSTRPGVMHACGHDGHTAMLLGAAKYLTETRNFDGTAIMIFQPAEEGGGGGDVMVKDGLMERFGVQEVYGLHNMPGIPVGKFAIRPGPLMAAADRFDIVIEGKGGHAARPHECVDTLLVACQVVNALQSIAARNVDPLESVVVSVCALAAGEAYNVIPQTARLKGTTRTLTEAVRDLAETRIRAITEATCAAYGAKASVDYRRGYPVTVNHPEQTDFIAKVAAEVGAGERAVDTTIVPLMGSEDFSYMLESRPGAYIFMGNGDTASVHHPKYNFNDEAIPYGVSLWAKVIETAMPAR
ncbi:MAG: M20 aminoacylase family protein [Microvirga sp.]